MAEPIKMAFGMWTRVRPIVCLTLDGGAHWWNLANMIERYKYGGDVAFLSNYSNHLLSLLHYSGQF